MGLENILFNHIYLLGSKRYSSNARLDFFVILGSCNIFLHIPFIFMIINSSGATSFHVWDFTTIAFITIVNFILTPIVLVLLSIFLSRLSAKLKIFLLIFVGLLGFNTGFLYTLDDATPDLKVFLLAVLPIAGFIILRMHRYVFLSLACGFNNPCICHCFFNIDSSTNTNDEELWGTNSKYQQ